ncbi:hypothetical protein D3C86_2184370 [compost metagenome]
MNVLQADLLQHRHCQVATLGSGRIGIDDQRFHQDVADLLAWVQRSIGILEDDLDLPADFRRQIALEDIDLLAVDEEFA